MSDHENEPWYRTEYDGPVPTPAVVPDRDALAEALHAAMCCDDWAEIEEFARSQQQVSPDFYEIADALLASGLFRTEAKLVDELAATAAFYVSDRVLTHPNPRARWSRSDLEVDLRDAFLSTSRRPAQETS